MIRELSDEGLDQWIRDLTIGIYVSWGVFYLGVIVGLMVSSRGLYASVAAIGCCLLFSLLRVPLRLEKRARQVEEEEE